MEKKEYRRCKKIKNKLYSILIFFVFCIFINSIVNAKYIIENQFEIANLNIDRTKPKIELISIDNTNSEYKNYANKNHTITIKLKIIEENIKSINFDKEHIKSKLDNNYINGDSMNLEKIEDRQNEKIYEIKISNISGNGNLKIDLLEGIAIDKGDLTNSFKEIDTKIIIDNIAPEGIFSENKIADGKVKGSIKLSEKIRNIEGWNFSQDNLNIEKVFTNNISYELPVIDYAGNKSIVKVSITNATYIKLIYASHNSVVGWSFGYGNYDVAGKEAIAKNSIYKTEALAFNISGNIDEDFVQAKSYIYTYWGEGSYGRCTTSGILYNYGYNPLDGSYKSMKSTDLVTIENKKYFQLGGSGINSYLNTDANGNNPMPGSVAPLYKYGICGINLKLKDYSEFSVIYQILVDGVGWINACSNGKECMYSKQRPMSAFRIALIPKTEEQYVLDTWNKDVGTYNL